MMGRRRQTPRSCWEKTKEKKDVQRRKYWRRRRQESKRGRTEVQESGGDSGAHTQVSQKAWMASGSRTLVTRMQRRRGAKERRARRRQAVDETPHKRGTHYKILTMRASLYLLSSAGCVLRTTSW